MGGGPPEDEEDERKRIARAVEVTVQMLQARKGVVVHCVGGRGRTGTVLGCALREMGLASNDVVTFLDHTHKIRGKPGWPESPWQAALVRGWRSGA